MCLVAETLWKVVDDNVLSLVAHAVFYAFEVPFSPIFPNTLFDE